MKRLIIFCTAILVMLGQVALAESGPSWRISAGPSMIYDPGTQKIGAGGHVTLGYRVVPAWEVELYGASSTDFEVENDLTQGDAAVSLLTIGGRYLAPLGDKSTAYFALGAGVLELEADKAPAGNDDTRRGGIGRFGIGVDYAVIPDLGVTWGAGFNRGFGGTDEIVLYDLTLSLFYAW